MSLSAHLLRSAFFLAIGYGAGGLASLIGMQHYSTRLAVVAALVVLAWDVLVMRPHCQEA